MSCCVGEGWGTEIEDLCSRLFVITVDSENSWTTRKVTENTGLYKYSERSGVCSLWIFVGKGNGLLECWSVKS